MLPRKGLLSGDDTNIQDIAFLPVIKWNVAVSLKGHIRSFREAMIRGETEITLTEVKLRKSGQVAA